MRRALDLAEILCMIACACVLLVLLAIFAPRALDDFESMEDL